MKAETPLLYRTKLSSALLYSAGFTFFTGALIYIALFDTEEATVDPSIFLVLAFFVGLYITQLAKHPPQSRNAMLTLTLSSLAVTLLSVILFPKATLLVIGVGLFGVLGAYYAWINVITRQPIIQADEQTLQLHNGLFRGKSFAVHWENVEKISLHTQPIFGGTKRTFLGVRLKDEASFLLSNHREQSKILRKVINSNLKIYSSHLVSDVSQLEVAKAQLLQELEQYRAPKSEIVS